MATAVSEYEKLLAKWVDGDTVIASQMFGKPCLKVHGKAFVAQHLDTVVFKLTGPEHAKALAVPGAVLWDPSGKGRPMKEWVALPAAASKMFQALATAAAAYVAQGAA